VELIYEIEECAQEDYRIVAEFNVWLGQTEIMDNPLAIPEVKKKIVEYIEVGLKKPNIMYFQAACYYDLQTRFVFDAETFTLDGAKYYWRRYLGDVKDDCLQFRGWEYAFKYADFNDVVKMKYFSKYLYEIYLHKRRESGSVWYVPPLMKALEFTGIQFWCENHGKFFCNHSRGRRTMTLPLNISCLMSDLEFFKNLLLREKNFALGPLKKILMGRSFCEVIAGVVTYFMLQSPVEKKIVDFYIRFKTLIDFGLMLRNFKGSQIILNRITDLIRREEKKIIRPMRRYDLRADGCTVEDRVVDKTLVDDVLSTRMILIDHQEMVSDVTSGNPIVGAMMRESSVDDEVVWPNYYVCARVGVNRPRGELGLLWDPDREVLATDNLRNKESFDTPAPRRRGRRRRNRKKKVKGSENVVKS
jgi:hypothetical protein